MTDSPAIPGQPDGIEDDTNALPDIHRAAQRVVAYVSATGDGLYDTQDGHPLYARDLEALRRTPDTIDALTAERDRARDQLLRTSRQLYAIREARAHTCERDCTEGGCDFDASSFIDRLDEILTTPDTWEIIDSGDSASGLGSPRRAQDDLLDVVRRYGDARGALALAEGYDAYADADRRADELWLEMLRLAEAAEQEATRLRAERDEARQDYRDLVPRLEQAERDLLNERYEHRQTSAAEDEARERAERLQDALTNAHRTLNALDATSRYGVRLTIADPTGPHPMDRLTGSITVLGFETPSTGQEIGIVLADALAVHVGAQVDATLIEPAKLGDPPAVDVQALLEETRAALAAADSDQDRTDIVEELLEGWYAAWPDTALTSPHQAIAGELVRLLQPGPVTLTIPADLWAGLAQRIRAGHAERLGQAIADNATRHTESEGER